MSNSKKCRERVERGDMDMHPTRCGIGGDEPEGLNSPTLPIASPVKESPKAPRQGPLRPLSPPPPPPPPPPSSNLAVSFVRDNSNHITEALIAMGTDPDTAIILGQKCLTLDEAVEYLPRSDSQP